ncbi:MAG: hypothetical protein LUG93_14655 [Lachnospiraceae bacterium]|nr:hypothetical protein [Lachnospiraceae bacterium]
MLGKVKAMLENYPGLYDVIYKLYVLILFVPFSDEHNIIREYKKVFGVSPNLVNPQTLNEKIQWLKLNDHRDINTLCADKFASREFWKSYGEEHLVPLLFQTKDYRKVNSDNIREFPCIVKCNNGCGTWQIIRDENNVDWKKLQKRCKSWLSSSKFFYKLTAEWQYKNIDNCIIVEKLLTNEDGSIPNDYKFHCINGEIAFIYCSVARENGNYRVCYDNDWNKLPFIWVQKRKIGRSDLNAVDIAPPQNLKLMSKIATDIAKNWDYVRVDFYECRGKLYYGEITLHHGSGHDVFSPEDYDLKYGQMLHLHKRC